MLKILSSQHLINQCLEQARKSSEDLVAGYEIHFYITCSMNSVRVQSRDTPKCKSVTDQWSWRLYCGCWQVLEMLSHLKSEVLSPGFKPSNENARFYWSQVISGIWSLDWDECIEHPPGSWNSSRNAKFANANVMEMRNVVLNMNENPLIILQMSSNVSILQGHDCIVYWGAIFLPDILL